MATICLMSKKARFVPLFADSAEEGRFVHYNEAWKRAISIVGQIESVVDDLTVLKRETV